MKVRLWVGDKYKDSQGNVYTYVGYTRDRWARLFLDNVPVEILGKREGKNIRCFGKDHSVILEKITEGAK
jgi:hypothetical protein